MRLKRTSGHGPHSSTVYAAAFAALLAVPHALASTACVMSSSQIEQGRAIRTGKPSYDEFFEAVRALREESLRAEELVIEGRADLARVLALDPRAPIDETLEAARAHLARLRASGVLLEIEIAPEARLVPARGGRSLRAEDRSLLEAIEACLQRSIAASKRLGELSKRAATLSWRRATLEAESPQAFARHPQRRAVTREIYAAEEVIAEAGAAGSKYAGMASKFVLDLADAVGAGAGLDRRSAAGGAARRPLAGSPSAPGRGSAAVAPRPPAGSPSTPGHGAAAAGKPPAGSPMTPARGSAAAAPEPSAGNPGAPGRENAGDAPKPPASPAGEDDFDP